MISILLEKFLNNRLFKIGNSHGGTDPQRSIFWTDKGETSIFFLPKLYKTSIQKITKMGTSSLISNTDVINNDLSLGIQL